MNGHVRQRSASSFELRYKKAGRTFTKTVRCGSKAEAKRALRHLIVEHDKGIAAIAPAKMLVTDWLRQWLDLTAADVRPITAERYEAAVRLYLAPALGHIKLRDLAPAQSRLRSQHGPSAVVIEARAG